MPVTSIEQISAILENQALDKDGEISQAYLITAVRQEARRAQAEKDKAAAAAKEAEHSTQE